MDSMAEIKQTFFQECEDLLSEMEVGLLDMDDGGADSETVNAVFRAVHSIKGGAGAFGLDELVKFAHIFETTLDAIRSDRLEATSDVMKVLLRSADVLADLVRAAREGEEAPDNPRAVALIEELSAMVGDTPEEEDDEGESGPIDFAPVGLDFDFDSDDDDMGGLPDLGDIDSDELQTFAISFRPASSLYTNANETVLVFRNLAEIGELEIQCDDSAIPLLDDLTPEGAYLAWEITVATHQSEDELRDVFAFVEDDCELEITLQDLDAEDNEDPLQEIEEPEEARLEIVGANSEAPEKVAVNEDGADASSAPTAAVEKSSAPKEASEHSPLKNSAPTKKAPSKPEKSSGRAPVKVSTADTTIRVNLDRVDRLVNLIGELVINQAMLTEGVLEAGIERGDSVESGLEELKQLTREIQESVMAIRAQPVKTLFQRMSRIVREASDATNKTVRLVTEGEATEVDKTVIERLADPLTHMIRNAVDHGLETPEKRVANGKPAEGIVSLTAAHRSGRVVIEVSDDGAGINRERVKNIAIEKGLISEDDQLSDSEIDNILFMPGFSTAGEVSNLSGRGVGMDVVKRAIQAVGGKISIASQPGHGSTFSISLPLTLAILDGMVVEVADQTLVVPLTAIVETLKPSADDIHELGADANVLSIRGEFIPVVDIGLCMGYRSEPADPLKGVALSVETEDGARAALIVDAIQDQRQVVIKSLEENYGNVASVAAATILGDGRIALILDIDSVINEIGPARSFQDNRIAAAG